jgi:predicted molibdopterin-dependent oxidoreductase YjgC
MQIQCNYEKVMVTLTINGQKVTVRKFSTVLDAARKLSIPIPTLCHHPELSPYGGCRLCLVEIKGSPKPVASCTTFARDGMDVTTSSPRLETLRKKTLELILSDHPKDCMVCERAGDCRLQELAYFYGIRENRFGGEQRVFAKSDDNPFIQRDMEKCILCGQCVRVCDEVQGVGAIDFAYRGMKTKVTPPFERNLSCEFCGQCVAVCPTGALTGKMWAQRGRQRFHEVDTVCPYCGCGCNITLHVRRNEVIRVSSRPNTMNEGWLCVKGRFGYGFIHSPDRLKKPLIRIAPKNDSLWNVHTASPINYLSSLFKEVSWDEALDYTATHLKEIKEQYGPDSIGGLSSARCTNEENYLFQKFIRTALKTNNIDHCARY